MTQASHVGVFNQILLQLARRLEINIPAICVGQGLLLTEYY